MERKNVYKIIDGERDYQDSLNPKMDHKGFPTVEAELLMMEEYLKDARTAWTHSHANAVPALEIMRKVVGMGIRCFENHGVPKRKPRKIKVNQ